jgi:S-adenosylmethionine synthetase
MWYSSAIHEQSADINQGVDRSSQKSKAGDQGMMFGYATNETENYMPLALDFHKLLQELAILREKTTKSLIYPDAKSQVTLEYSDDNKPTRIDAIVISTQHDFDEEATMLAKIKRYC